MLVIISDLHLTDGTSGETIHEGAFRIFRERFRDLVYDASKRAPDPAHPNGRYEPLKGVDLILLGDIFDIIRSDKWCHAGPRVRPWGDYRDPEIQQVVSDITDDILKNNRASLADLRSLTDPRVTTVPPPMPDGSVAQGISREPSDPQRVPVPVRIHYMVGNHDWMYHLVEPAYEPLRERMRQAMALANPPGPFPWDAERESPTIMQLFREHQVLARHGDQYDSNNYDMKKKTRDASSLGDAIVIELLNRFPEEVIDKLGGKLSPACRNGLRELDNVRPLTIIPVWLDGLLKNTCEAEHAGEIKAIWNHRLDNFLSIDFVKQRLPLWLKLGMRLSNDASLASLSHLAISIKHWIQKPDTLADNAAKEPMFVRGEARFVTYGHTHNYEIVPLCVERKNGGNVERVEMNSGTWRAVHELTKLRPAEEQFVGYHVMTYLAFFKDDEYKGRAFETWSGALSTS